MDGYLETKKEQDSASGILSYAQEKKDEKFIRAYEKSVGKVKSKKVNTNPIVLRKKDYLDLLVILVDFQMQMDIYFDIINPLNIMDFLRPEFYFFETGGNIKKREKHIEEHLQGYLNLGRSLELLMGNYYKLVIEFVTGIDIFLKFHDKFYDIYCGYDSELVLGNLNNATINIEFVKKDLTEYLVGIGAWSKWNTVTEGLIRW